MTKLLTTISIFVASLFYTSSAISGEQYLQLHGFSKHVKERTVGSWNENNYGLGYRNQMNKDFAYQVGYYKNSYFKDTFYGVINYTPLHINNFSAGVFGGYASGYETEYPVIGGLMLNYIKNKYNVSLRFVPSVSATTTSVVAIEFGIKF